MSVWDGPYPEQPEEERESAWEDPETDESWRGDLHADDWPEQLAGPEYWLWKHLYDEEEGQ